MIGPIEECSKTFEDLHYIYDAIRSPKLNPMNEFVANVLDKIKVNNPWVYVLIITSFQGLFAFAAEKPELFEGLPGDQYSIMIVSAIFAYIGPRTKRYMESKGLADQEVRDPDFDD